ncbi:MAG: type IV pilus assembly protein PilM [Egibacteraceae bacterium]
MSVQIGLDIGSSAVRAVQLKIGGRGPAKLERIGQVLLPVGAVEAGQITDPEAVTASLRELWGRYRFASRKVALGVASQQVVVRHVDVPWVAEAERAQALQFLVGEHLPIPVEDAYIDSYPIEHYETEDGQRLTRTLLVGTQRDTIDTLVGVVEAAGLKPVSIDLDPLAALRSLTGADSVGDECQMVLDVGHGVTDLVVQQGGVPHFVRILLMGGHAITSAMADELGLSYEDAEATKLSAAGASTFGASGAARTLVHHVSRFEEEVRGSLHFYQAQPDAVTVDSVVLTGGGAQLPGLAERLQSALRLPVEQGYSLGELKIGRIGIDDDQLVQAQRYLAVAVGLALGRAA